MKPKSKKDKLLNIIKLARDNKRGSVLIPVLVVGTFLIMITAALMVRVNTTSELNRNINFSENAYLAARSGITLLADKSNADPTFAQNVFSSTYASEAEAENHPIHMNFNNLGECDISLYELKNKTDDSGQIVEKEVQAKCVGTYEGNKFTLTRKLTINKTTTGTQPVAKVKPSAFQSYDDSSLDIVGGVDGDVYVLGNGQLTTKLNRYGETPMHNVICKRGFVQSSQSDECYFQNLVIGEYLSVSQIATGADLSVGMEGAEHPFMSVALRAKVGGVMRSSGDILNSGHLRVGYNNVEEYNGIKAVDNPITPNNVESIFPQNGNIPDVKLKEQHTAIISEGNVIIGKSVQTSSYEDMTPVLDADGNYQLQNDYGWNSVYVFGDIVAGGDVDLAATTVIYGDIYSNGTVTLQAGNVRIKGTVYCKDFVSNGLVSSMVNISGAAKKVYAYGTANVSDYERSMCEFVVGDAAKAACESKIPNPVDSGAKANFDKFTNGQLTAPLTKFPTTTKVNNADVQVSSLPKIDPAEFNITEIDSTHFLRQVFPAGSGNNFSAMLVRTGLNTWNCRDMLYITRSCVIEGDVCEDIYIDTSKYHEDIDIFVKGSLSNLGRDQWGNAFGKTRAISVNDDDGKHRIRIFLYSGSKINISNARGIWAAGSGVNYAHDLTADGTDIYTSFALDESYNARFVRPDKDSIKDSPVNVDYSKVARLYIFAEDRTGYAAEHSNSDAGYVEPDINFGATGQVPGYIVAPSIDIVASDSNNGVRYLDGTTITGATYPCFYGMLMCHYATFPAASSSYIKYDPRMVDPETRGLEGDELAAAIQEYNKIMSQFSDDIEGIIYYPDDDGDDDSSDPGSGGGSTTTTWTITVE